MQAGIQRLLQPPRRQDGAHGQQARHAGPHIVARDFVARQADARRVEPGAVSQPAVLLPLGAVEDHGPHLPLNTDNVIVEALCLEAARRAPGERLVMPAVAYGLDEHHMDFPGTITVEPASPRDTNRG